MTLCSLSDVKTLLGITDNTKDTLLNLYIKQVSSAIESYIGYKLARGTYTEELHSVNYRQLLKLGHFPIQSVSAVTINDVAETDYKVLPEWASIGFLYKQDGWCGSVMTRGMNEDVVSGTYIIKVSYTAGYYLPGDANYVEGADSSLPYDIVTACLKGVVELYNKQGIEGIKQHSEGGISTTYGDSVSGGLSSAVTSLLEDYKEIGVA